jgi:hypothetical protein
MTYRKDDWTVGKTTDSWKDKTIIPSIKIRFFAALNYGDSEKENLSNKFGSLQQKIFYKYPL